MGEFKRLIYRRSEYGKERDMGKNESVRAGAK